MKAEADELLIAKSSFFDESWYVTTYPDVVMSGIVPARHYLRYGARMGRDPGPDFGSRSYLQANPDVARASVNPLLHYERSGRIEGRRIQYVATEAPTAAVKAPPTVDVVVPVYNALEDVKSCLVSLASVKSSFPVRVLVVNDGSDGATTAWLRRAVFQLATAETSFELIEHTDNRGYTVAVNTGLKASRADYIVTLNSDTIVTSDWLDGLVRCLESAAEIGIVGPLSNAATWQNVPDLLDREGQHAINQLPSGLTPEHMAKYVRDVSQHTNPRTTFVNGFCFLMSRAVIEAVGYMDEEAFPSGYGEENDFCIRAMDAGFALAYADDVYVFHAKSKSFGTARRLELSKAGGQALRHKHGSAKFTDLVKKVQQTEEMDEVRQRVRAVLDTREGDSVVSAHEMRLQPAGVYSAKGYQVDPKIFGASLTLPFSEDALGVPSLNIGIHLHLHYTDLLDEFAAYLAHIPIGFSLYVSVPQGTDLGQVTKRFGAALPQAQIQVKSFPNRGRDIGPFLAGFGAALSQHTYICHIHSKRSSHNPSKNDWRMQLLSNLMGSRSIVGETFRLFDQNPNLGMVFPDYHWSLETQISWGTNYAICRDLSDRIGVPISPVHMAPFAAGSMFWARSDALRPLFDLGLGFEDFPEEDKQIDGTLAHAVERLLGNIVLSTGHTLHQVRSAKPYDLKTYYTRQWPYQTKAESELRDQGERYRDERKKEPAQVGLLCANSGGYDETVAHEHLDPRIDYHLVTDFPAPDCGFWIRHDMHQDGDATGRARAVKTNPLTYIGQYDIGIWVDANVMIRKPLDRYLDMVRANPDVPIFGIPHPHRLCLYEEAEAVIRHNKADFKKVRAQMQAYGDLGFPKKHGLIETNFLIYNLRHPKIAELLAAWNHEVSHRTHRDQLSLNFVLWKLGLNWLPLMTEGRNLRAHDDFAYFGHGPNSGYQTPTLPDHAPASRKLIQVT